MPLYECARNAENRIKLKPELTDAIVVGSDKVIATIRVFYRNNRSK